MTTRKTERILNLTICLLVSDRYLSKSRIREAVEGYHDLSDAAFERTFERDKDELRGLGVPIEVGSFDPLFDDEPGYRIRRQDFELPAIELDAEEASVVGVAARVWQHASMAESTMSALAKLRAAGIEPDPSQLAALEPSVQATEPAFAPLWGAVLDRVRVRFTYRDGDQRTLEPWGLTSSKGRWYVVGWDTDRQDTRMFKLSRIPDLPKRVSRAGAYAVPEDLDLRNLARSLTPREPTMEAVLAIRTGRAPALARRGEREGVGTDLPSGFEVLAVAYGDMWSLAEEIRQHGADVVVLEPAELRDAVIRGLARWRRRSRRVTSQAQVRRLLSLVPYLREHDGVPLADVATAFGITPEVLREDLNVLWMCGLPGLRPGDLIDIDMDGVDGEGVIHLSNADYLTRPLRLSADEALALVLALRTLREIAGPGKRDVVDRALKKLEAAAGNVSATDQASVAVTAARDDIQARVNDGLQRGKRLDLTYDVASRAETTRRLVDPLRVFVLEGYGYLEAWCYSASALRTFRLDRIAAVEVTETDVEPHDVTLKDLSSGWYETLRDSPLVRLELAPYAAWVAEYYPTETVTRGDDGRLVVTLHITDPAWLRSLLLRLGGGAKVLDPAEAGDSAVETAREALDQYAALGLA